MKLLLATHGFPPELVGGVELSVSRLASTLARRGHRLSVVSGTLRRSSGESAVRVDREALHGTGGERIDVARIARSDLYFDHWHKSHSAAASKAFRDILREVRPDVVHVHHWLRLSRDLVLVAARERIPSVITLHDAWASCPIVFRVRPDTQAACDATVGPHPCIACAARIPPRTAWIPAESAYLMLAERQRDIGRELDLARARIAPSLAHASALERQLGRAPGSLAFDVIAPAADDRIAHARASPAASDALDLRASKRLHLVSWSQIAKHKGTDLLLEAFLAACGELGGSAALRLDIHGAPADPEFAARLRDRSQDLPVRWKGGFEAHALDSVIDPGAQVFVLATRAHESYGLSVDEAARLGLALVLPDVPAFRERCAEAANFYESGNPASLKLQLLRLAREPGLLARARAAAAEWATRLESATSIVERHEAIYARAAAAGAPPAPPANWFDERMSAQATLEWDRALSQSGTQALGFESPGRAAP